MDSAERMRDGRVGRNQEQHDARPTGATGSTEDTTGPMNLPHRVIRELFQTETILEIVGLVLHLWVEAEEPLLERSLGLVNHFFGFPAFLFSRGSFREDASR